MAVHSRNDRGERTPSVVSKKPSIQSNPHIELTNALSSIFPTKTEETKATRTRRILGDTAKTLSDEQIEAITTQFQFLVETWLDQFEKDVFEGQTLKELLGDSAYANYKQD